MQGLMRRALSLAAAAAWRRRCSPRRRWLSKRSKCPSSRAISVASRYYVAKHLKLFEKHGVDIELVYGTGIQPANIFVSGSADSRRIRGRAWRDGELQGPGPQIARARAAIAAAEPDRSQRRADAERGQALSAEHHRPERAQDRHQRTRCLDRHGDALHAASKPGSIRTRTSPSCRSAIPARCWRRSRTR